MNTPGEIKTDPATEMAAERTMLAWIRTGLALMGFGFVVAKFGLFLQKLAEIKNIHIKVAANQSASVWIGIALVMLGVAVNVAAATRFAALIRRLHAGDKAKPMRWELAASVAIIMALIGLGIAGYLLRLK
jgi:putative membrane protein